MGYPVQQSTTAIPLEFFMKQSADHVSGATGLTPTVTLSKNGGAFASPSGAVSEVGNGWYKVAPNATDNNTLGTLKLNATSAGADQCPEIYTVVAFNPLDSAALGLTAMPITSNVKKNQALNSFEFLMTDSTNHAPAPNKTVTVTRSIDGGAFATGSLSAVTEVGNGIYKVNFAAADLNGNVITLLATASGCDSTLERIVTQP